MRDRHEAVKCSDHCPLQQRRTPREANSRCGEFPTEEDLTVRQWIPLYRILPWRWIGDSRDPRKCGTKWRKTRINSCMDRKIDTMNRIYSLPSPLWITFSVCSMPWSKYDANPVVCLSIEILESDERRKMECIAPSIVRSAMRSDTSSVLIVLSMRCEWSSIERCDQMVWAG